jgi:hypothetical protein
MADAPQVALKLDAFTYQKRADGGTTIRGADGRPLEPGLYAIDFGGRETIVDVRAQQAVGGFVEAERLRQQNRSKQERQ